MSDEQAAPARPRYDIIIRPDNLFRHVVRPVLRRTEAEINDAIGEDATRFHYDGEVVDMTPAMAARIDELCGNAPGLWIELQRAFEFRQSVAYMGDLIEVRDGRQFSFTHIRPGHENLQDRVAAYCKEKQARCAAEREVARLKAEKDKQAQEHHKRWLAEDKKAKEAEAIKKAEEAKLKAEEARLKAEEAKLEAERHAEAQAIVQAQCEKFLRQPLPAGLQVLALEFKFDVLPKAKPDSAAEEAADEVLSAVMRQFRNILDSIGSSRDASYELTIFDEEGKTGGERLRLDIIARPEVLQEWCLLENGRYSFMKRLPIVLGERDDHLSITMKEIDKHLLADSLAYFIEEETGEETDVERIRFKGGEPFGRCHDPEFDFTQWATAAQATDEDFEQLATLCDSCYGDAALIASHLARLAAKPKSQSFLVPGLIPRGTVTLLLGNKKVGKSVAALELAVATACRENSWLGFPLTTSDVGGFSVYLAGEDTREEVERRARRMTGGELPLLLWTMPAEGGDINKALEKLKSEKVALLVVDPVRKYYRGDEDSSDAVNDFFVALETFARDKNCAVLGLHHLKRNANPKTVSEVAQVYRGSSVWLDRPRVTLGMLRRKGEATEIGIPAPDGLPLHNFDQSAMFSGVKRLHRDEATYRHIPETSGADATQEDRDELERVRQAVVRFLKSGEYVAKTGPTELFARKPEEVAGMSRATLRQAVETLVGNGCLHYTTDGGLSLGNPED